MAFESPIQDNNYNTERKNIVESKIIIVDDLSCDIRWRKSEPNHWTVYIEGLPFAVTRRNDGNLLADDVSSQPYHTNLTERKKSVAMTAVTQLLNGDVDKVK